MAKNTKKSKREPQTKRKPSDGLLKTSKADSSRKMVHGNISSNLANPWSPSSKEAYISGETKHKPANPRKLKIARPTLSKRGLKVKDDKNPSTALHTINNENDNNGGKETAKRDGKESAKRKEGTSCRNLGSRASKKTCRAKQGRQTS